MKNLLLTILLVLSYNFVFSQLEPCPEDPCIEIIDNSEFNVEDYFMLKSSSDRSIIDGREATLFESNPFVEIYFEDRKQINSIKMCFDDEVEFVNRDLYVIASTENLSSMSLEDVLKDRCLNYSMINGQIRNCETINIKPVQANYVRIQSGDFGVITFNALILGGGDEEEICGNGIDDDCDGDIDCEDDDCLPDYDLNALGTYSDCSELGSVSFTNNGDEELTITIQNCCSFDFSEDILINDLAVGVYDYIISNGNCLINGSFEIEDLDADSDCGNLDFVDGFDSWDLSSNTDIADDDSNFQDVLNQPCDGDHFSIIRSGEVSNGSAVFGDPITSPSGTGDILVLSTEHNGATNQSFLTGGQSHKISKCFDVDDGNSCLSFNFAMIFNDPINDGEHRHQPGFSFKVFEEDGTPIRSQSINSGDFNDLDLDACDGCINDLNWTPKCIDLEDHVGEKVCIEFEVKGCVVKGGIFQPDRPGTHGVTAFIEGLCNNCEDNKPTCELVVDPFICDGEIEFDFMTNNFQIVGLSLTELGGTPEFEFSFQNQLPNVSIDQLADNNNISLICGETYELHLNLQNECDGCDNKFEFEYNDISCSDNFEIDYPTAYLICDEETNSVWINVQQQNCQGCSYSWVPNENLLGSNLHSPLVLPNPSYDQAFNQTYEVTVQNLIGCTKSEEVIFSTGFTEELVVNENFCYIDISFSLSASFPISLDDFNVGLEQNWGIQNMLSMEEFQVDANTVNYSFCYDKCVLADISNIDLQINYSFQPSDPSDVIVIGNCDNSVEVGSFCISCYSKPWYVFIQNIFSPTLGPTPLDQVFNIDLTSSLADDCQDNFKSSVYRVEIDIFDRWGTLVFSSDLTAEDSCGEGLSGLEPQLVWDGMFGDDFVEAGALAYVVKIHSCSKEYVPSCVSCSGETTTCNDPATEVQIISGDVTIIF